MVQPEKRFDPPPPPPEGTCSLLLSTVEPALLLSSVEPTQLFRCTLLYYSLADGMVPICTAVVR